MTHIFSKYDGFKNDKPFYVDLEGGCCASKRRIDLRKLIGNTMLCIEVDENQHKKNTLKKMKIIDMMIYLWTFQVNISL